MSPAPVERDRIQTAMDRVLGGWAEHSDGALTVVALAAEAQPLRNALTQRHPDLKNAFYGQVRARGRTPDSEKRLRRQVRKLTELRAADAEEIARPKTDVEALVGALRQSMTENRLLRRQLADRTGVVRTLPAHSRIGDTTHPLPPGLVPSSDG
ncbi:polyketide synthase docking domain-containing protein [Streptomyces sp. NPDC005820]|uniref:polyketide synthase docking domain-containing protein n=1 Tax=Streptomyces sp. NPDC005820 TaxID=3157069 RepID=UPI0033EF2D8B